MSATDISLTIPVGRAFSTGGETVLDARIYLPSPMSEAQWQQMLTVLEAMKPVIVPELAQGSSIKDAVDQQKEANNV